MHTQTQKAFSEKNMLQDILVLEKDLIKSYGSYLCESSCPKMRTLLNSNIKTAGDDQFSVFQAMQVRGLYPTEQAPMQKLNEAKTKFTQTKNELN